MFAFCYNEDFNRIALRKAKIAYNFGLSECNRIQMDLNYPEPSISEFELSRFYSTVNS